MSAKCPKCGSTDLSRISLYDEEGIDGYECDKCDHSGMESDFDTMLDESAPKPSHTATPWKANRHMDSGDWVVREQDDWIIANCVDPDTDPTPDIAKANAEHIVKCVNGHESNQKIKLAARKFVNEFERAIKTGDVSAKGLPAQMLLGDAIIFAKELQSALKLAGEGE